ncbi:MAG: OPT family oligopeptide transporter [bacterium JZ-2024 1]
MKVKLKLMKRELTPDSLFWGIVLAAVFGMANAYLAVKVGMTISASIPAAVVSMAILRGLLKRGTILENNMVQTIASSGESLAAGVTFTIPAFFFLDYLGFEVRYFHILLWSLIGGLLGIGFMIPLRKRMIEEETEELKFPEGTACAEVLKAGDVGGVQAKWVFLGGLLGAGFKALVSVFRFFEETPGWVFGQKMRSMVQFELGPALAGVGYILGLRISTYVFLGGAVGWFVFLPLITYLGFFIPEPIFPASKVISELTPIEIWKNYIRYIGAGAVLGGGLMGLFKTLPLIYISIRREIQRMRMPEVSGGDLSPKWVAVILGFALLLMIFSPLPRNWLTIVGSLFFGFIFSVVSARMTGIVGSSSNPVSGMTIASMVVMSLVLFLFGFRESEGMLLALSFGASVCIAICMAGDLAQDLKTGYLVGATPWKQQIGELIGIIAPVFFIGAALFLIHAPAQTGGAGLGSEKFPAPQATLISLIVQGIFQRELPWEFILIGVVLALLVELVGMPTLAFAVGLYLPLRLSSTLLLGGIVAHLTQNTHKGILLGSGLVAGDALMGIFAVAVSVWAPQWLPSQPPFPFLFRPLSSLLAYIFLLIVMAYLSRGKREVTD